MLDTFLDARNITILLELVVFDKDWYWKHNQNCDLKQVWWDPEA